MSLLRFAARSMFASQFIVDGVRSVQKSDDLAEDAEAFTKKVVPMLQRIVPASYSSSIPEEPKTWVRIGGALKVVGGIMFATGIGRRLGAIFLVPAALMDVVMALPAKDAPADEKREGQRATLTQIALLGGAILATQDLQGKPNLRWRAVLGQKSAARQAVDLGGKSKALSAKAKRRAKKQAKKLAKRAAR